MENSDNAGLMNGQVFSDDGQLAVQFSIDVSSPEYFTLEEREKGDEWFLVGEYSSPVVAERERWRNGGGERCRVRGPFPLHKSVLSRQTHTGDATGFSG